MFKVIASVVVIASQVNGHAFLAQPAARNAMYAFGYDNPANYNHMSLNAGGPSTVQQLGHGLCGDSLSGPQEHMAGGKYANGVISKTYVEGSVIDIDIQVTAHHKGQFTFKLCDLGANPTNSMDATQTCFDQNELKRADGKGKSWLLPAPVHGGYELYSMKYVLPQGVTCERCVLQWHWVTGNSPGNYPEEFWNCADIAIISKNSAVPSQRQPVAPVAPVAAPVVSTPVEPVVAQPAPAPAVPTNADNKKCVSIVSHITNEWCAQVSCNQVYSSFCAWV